LCRGSAVEKHYIAVLRLRSFSHSFWKIHAKSGQSSEKSRSASMRNIIERALPQKSGRGGVEEIEAKGESVLSAVRHGIFVDAKDLLMFKPIYGRQNMPLLWSCDSLA